MPETLIRRPLRMSLTIPCARGRLVYRGQPLLMGVVNVTPDSFSDGGRFLNPQQAVRHGLRLASEGADLLDIGGVSTRPGAGQVPLKEELRRVIPVVERLARSVRIPLSVDTTSAEVARHAIEAGAAIINDVTALRGDPRMPAVAARSRAAMILMHMRGTPATMQRAPRYRHVVEDVRTFLAKALKLAQTAGIERARLLVDPGLGFGKTVTQNLQLLAGLPRLMSLGVPVVLGPSRKSFIGAVLNAQVHERLAGTLACVAHAQRCGVQIVRVHDVQPAAQLLRLLDAIRRQDG